MFRSSKTHYTRRDVSFSTCNTASAVKTVGTSACFHVFLRRFSFLKINSGVVQRNSQYRRASRARRCREYFYGGGGGGGVAGSANGAPALSPAALHLEFNDVSIFRIGGVSVSDAMLPVGQSDSMLGPLQARKTKVMVPRFHAVDGSGTYL